MSQYPPNNSQPPNWQQPWQGQPSYTQPQSYQQPGQWDASQYNQPTQAWQSAAPPPVPPTFRGKQPKSPKKPLTRRDKIISVGCFAVALLFLCGVIGVIATAANAHNGTTASAPTTIVVVPSDTPTAVVQSVLPTDTPTIAPTDTPVPTPTAKPTPRPTATPTQPIVQQPTPTTTPHCVAVNNNPWCYNFITPGNVIMNPPSAFCSYFNCVSTFWVDTNGYVAECGNGKYTHSASVNGACSRDGGVAQILYSH